MSTEVPEHSLEDSTVDSPSERRQSGFTAVNEYRDPLSDGRPRQISETTEALPHNVQPPYAPTGPDQRREEWTTAQLSPVSQKRKRSISMERSPRSQTTGKRRSSQEEGATGLYTETAHSHTGEQTQHYTVHEASQTQMEALAAAHYSETQAEAWASQQEQHQHPAAAHMNDAQLAAVLQRETQLGSHPHTLGALGASPEQRFPVADTTQQRQVEGAAPLTPQMDAPHLQKQRKRSVLSQFAYNDRPAKALLETSVTGQKPDVSHVGKERKSVMKANLLVIIASGVALCAKAILNRLPSISHRLQCIETLQFCSPRTVTRKPPYLIVTQRGQCQKSTTPNLSKLLLQLVK